jgi:hypothetical protein
VTPDAGSRRSGDHTGTPAGWAHHETRHHECEPREDTKRADQAERRPLRRCAADSVSGTAQDAGD